MSARGHMGGSERRHRRGRLPIREQSIPGAAQSAISPGNARARTVLGIALSAIHNGPVARATGSGLSRL